MEDTLVKEEVVNQILKLSEVKAQNFSSKLSNLKIKLRNITDNVEIEEEEDHFNI
jgi:hypothetical protein